MSLILRAQVAAAAHDVVPQWPLESFIAVNPLAGREAHPFSGAATPGVAITRTRDEYLADHERGRITDADLEAALLEANAEFGTHLTVAGRPIPAVRLAVLDLLTARWPGTPSAGPSSSWLDEYLSGWLGRYLSDDALWSMPRRERGFYGAWRALARWDRALPRAARRRLATTPESPDAALEWALNFLSVSPASVPAEIRQELTHLPGWVGHLKWRAEKVGDVDLISYLAVRFAVRAALGLGGGADGTASAPAEDAAQAESAADPTLWERAERVATRVGGAATSRADVAAVARVLGEHPVADHPITWQRAYELHYRAKLIGRLNGPAPEGPRPTMQLAMCIDPRSEGMRRHLERDETIETFGFAGFFGIPVRFARYGARGSIDALPALLSARHQLTEVAADPARVRAHVGAGRARDALRGATHIADASTTTPFAFAETTGWLYGAASVVRTLAPTLHARLQKALLGAPALDSAVTIADAFSLEERAALAETAIRMMGMRRFAPLVVLAGHASESTNNLYESALDCGACGGNPGAANARAATAILNDAEVRELLAERGLEIPADTHFVAGEHNTVTDAVELLDRHSLPASHRELAQRFDESQRAAGDSLAVERAADLPGATSSTTPRAVRRRAHDWAEVYPELGLAGNAAMIIGPRRMTRGVDLGRRVFLHSYDTAMDREGAALETIMTAPLIVAQWINHQYYFSALNPDTLGAGTKTIHNAIGTIGVLAGQGGDLRRGLPWQSVGLGRELFHEPMRLSVIIEAPLERIGRIVSGNQVLRNLLDNDWITLTARDDSSAPWHRYTRYGWNRTATPSEGAAQ